MAESSQEPPQKNASVPPEIQVLLDQLRAVKTETEDSLKTAQLASKTASETNEVLRRISELKTQAEEQAKSAELSRQKADSEALFAFNAKRACEEHSTAIASLKGTVEAEANLIVTNKQKSDELLASVNASKATIASDQTTIADKRREVEQSAAAIVKAAEAGAARLSEVETSRVSAETALKETIEAQKGAVAAQTAAAAAQKAATDARTASDEATKQAEAFAKQSEILTVTITGHQKMAKELVEQTQTLLREAQSTQANLKTLFEHLQQSDKIATDHEVRVTELTKNIDALIGRVEGLLPGATSAGLASSFNKQKTRFARPQALWLWTFVATIGLLIVIAIPSFFAAVGMGMWGSVDTTWNDTWRSLVLRLPIVLPLVWIGIYSARNYMMSIRLEEDYAYKEAISTAFEGYKREMEKIVAEDAQPTPIATLCINVLSAIAERPGRIYEGKQEDINLMTEVRAAIDKSMELGKKKVATS